MAPRAHSISADFELLVKTSLAQASHARAQHAQAQHAYAPDVQAPQFAQAPFAPEAPSPTQQQHARRHHHGSKAPSARRGSDGGGRGEAGGKGRPVFPLEEQSPPQDFVTIDVRLFHTESTAFVRAPPFSGAKQLVDTTQDATPYNVLRIESIGFNSSVRLRSAVTLHYICFTKRGFLKTMKQPKGTLCDLREHMTDPTIDPSHSSGPVTQFQSLHDPRWYVGFNRRGGRLSGFHWNKPRWTAEKQRELRKLYSFVKVTVTPSGGTDSAAASPLGPMARAGDHEAMKDLIDRVREIRPT